jgi:DNA ligase (NAD+)
MGQVKELEKRLRAASAAYYGGGDAIMSDQEFDRLRDELEELDPHNSFLAEVGAPADSALQKVSHTIPMGSLKKISPGPNQLSEFETWSRSLNGSKIAVQFKLDGLSIELVYRKGRFVQAITRGDGDVGEDVTHTIKHAQGFPLKISVADRQVSVRCEALLYIADWKKHFADKANPRNAASGLVRRTDAQGSKHLRLVAFDVLYDTSLFKTEQDRINWLMVEKFTTTPSFLVDKAGVKATIDSIYAKRDTLPYEIDGAVVKVNDIAQQERLGEHNGRPYWARAWKFPAMGGHTVLKDVEWTVGTRGWVNPVAKVEPVEVGGTTIRNVTLHNRDEIKRLGLCIGDEVEVVRAGDVIPNIVRVVAQGSKRKPIKIDTCPACGATLREDGPRLICSKMEQCPGVGSKRLKKWIKKREILHLGDTYTDALVDAGYTTIPQLYELTIEKMVKAGIGEGMAKKIMAQIDKSRTCSLANLIGSLSMDMVGRSEASNLVGHGVDTLAKWKKLTAKAIGLLPGYQGTKGSRIAAAVEENWPLIEAVAEHLTITNGRPKPSNGKLTGKSFCFTGTMTNPRKTLEQKVNDAGGQIRSVSKELDFLVIADPNSLSSKAAKARKLGVKLISEQDFLKML